MKALFKGIVHFEIKIWYLSAYPKGIQDVGVFFSSVDTILMFLGQTVLVCQSYNGRRLKSCVSTTLQTHPPSSVDADEPERARTHVTHRMCVRTQITWTWLCTRGKKRYKYCSFSHTNRLFRVLGHQCVVTMGNCLILISLCMFFFPLIETVTYTCHYMTDQTRTVWPKNIKIGSTEEKRHLHIGCPWGKLIDTKF